MKLTKSINLAGQVFNIDEDAWQTLKSYLEEVESVLRSNVKEDEQDETTEVMRDIEARIAELFAVQLNKTHLEVVEMPLVESVIEQLGSPKSYVTDETDERSGANVTKGEKVRHRLYRDEENKILGGVCSGIAAMLGWDAVWVRVIMAGLAFLTHGIMVLIYLFMWVVTPAARTAAQRLEMRGEVASVENIQKEVERMKQYIEQRGVRNTFGTILRVMLKVFMGFIIFLFFIPAFAMLFSAIAVLVKGTVTLTHVPLFSDLSMFNGNIWLTSIYCILLFIAFALPVFALMYWAIKYMRQRQHPSDNFWWGVAFFWLVVLILGMGMTIFSFLKSGAPQGFF